MWIVFQILNVSAIVLANLCVSYIMTSQNEEAEEMMRKIEKEEEQLAYDDPDKKVFHLCIVNLVIGWVFYQYMSRCFMYLCMQARIYARGPGPGWQIFRGGILKKSRLKYGMWKKKAVHKREI